MLSRCMLAGARVGEQLVETTVDQRAVKLLKADYGHRGNRPLLLNVN